MCVPAPWRRLRNRPCGDASRGAGPRLQALATLGLFVGAFLTHAQGRALDSAESRELGAGQALSQTAATVAAADSPAEPAWSPRERRILASLALDPNAALPPSRSNRWADDPAAAAFGRALFFDTGLSGSGRLSCASCHRPELYFTDGLPRSAGAQTTLRNAPTIVGAAYQSWFYWDGRRDSLWSQALIPFEAPEEMGGSRVGVLRHIAEVAELRQAYEALFGALPELSDLTGQAGPLGDRQAQAAWERLTGAQRRAIDTAFANVGKAIEAYERTERPPPSRLDRYIETVLTEGEAEAAGWLSPSARRGLRLFIDDERTRCLRCHNGPLMSNGSFHNIGTGNFSGERLDFGRVFGIRAALMDPFNCLGAFSDAPADACSELKFLNVGPHVPLDGAFKVPSLRNVAATGPYFHDGSRANLREVLAHYNEPPTGQGPPHELVPMGLDDAELEALLALLQSLGPATEGR